jgi:hypothetical protein
MSGSYVTDIWEKDPHRAFFSELWGLLYSGFVRGVSGAVKSVEITEIFQTCLGMCCVGRNRQIQIIGIGSFVKNFCIGK